MKMKKTLALILAGTMALSLSACGGGSQRSSGDNTQGKKNNGSISTGHFLKPAHRAEICRMCSGCILTIVRSL